MCWTYASNMTQEQIFKELESILNSPIKSFNDFNTTSVLSILFCNIGLYGKSNRETSFEIMDKFIDYLQTKKPMYLPESGLEAMYHPELIKKIYWYAKNYDIDYTKLEDSDYKNNVIIYLSSKLNEYDQELEKNLFYRFNKYMSKIYLVSEDDHKFYNWTTIGLGVVIGASLGLVLRKYLQ